MKQKEAFDRRHHAQPKEISPGDQVLLKQEKTTTKPPYNPDPFTVEKVEGNRLTLNKGEQRRVRDKNKVKRIPQRPAIFQKTKVVVVPAESSDSEVDIDMQKLRETIQIESATTTANTEEPELESPTTENMPELDSATTTEETQEPDHTFIPTNEMNAHLQQLLAAAEARISETNATTSRDSRAQEAEEQHTPTPASHNQTSPRLPEDRRITRSQGITLAWNPVMNDASVLVGSDETI